MSKFKIELNEEGVKGLLRSEEMKKICEEHANRALGKLGKGYSVDTKTRETRVIAKVIAESQKARKDNLENNTILKALGGK